MTKGQRKEFAKQADSWCGVKYQHRGTTRHGCDCTGLIIGAMQELGYMSNYRLREYPFQWNLHAGAGDYLLEELRKVADEASDQTPEPGDILVFRFGRCAAHAGVVTSWPLFVHALSTNGHVCKASARGRLWKARRVQRYRFNADKLKEFN